MAVLKTIAILSLAFAVVVAINGTDGSVPGPDLSSSTLSHRTTKPPSTTTPKPTSAPTPPPTTPEPTPPPTTPKPTPPPTTTPKPTPPPTTTPKPTPPPTTPTPTPTTRKPTPTPAPGPTPKPAPTPDPQVGEWFAKYAGTNRTCIALKAAIQITIPYEGGNKTLAVNVPVNTTVTGNCEEKIQTISLGWAQNGTNQSSAITFTFNKTSDKFDLEQIQLDLSVLIPGQNWTNFSYVHNTSEFATPLGKSYKCAKEEVLNGTTDALKLHVSHLQLQAYRNTTSANFDSAFDCAGSETPDVVPIAVGCALAALVIVVLIAYLIGRRRSQARGYLSMFAENKREEDYIPMKDLSCFKF